MVKGFVKKKLLIDNMQFIHEFTRLLVQIKALNIQFLCML